MTKVPFLSFEWWRATETPRWALICGALCMLGLSVGANMYSSLHVENQKRVDANRAEQIRLLLNDMAQFQAAVATFSNEMASDKKVSAATKAALIKNLNDQFSRAREIETLVPSDHENLASLRQSIVSLIGAIPDKDDLPSMKKFWSAAGKVTLNKNILNDRLQRSI